MIVRTNMFEPLLEACPSFQPAWNEFLQEWSDDADPPRYLALGKLARHLIAMLERGDTDTFPEVFAVIERWHVEGEHYVQEAATVGLLEGLQNRNLHSRTKPEQFRQYLFPESERWWDKLNDFWSSGKPLSDD